MCVRACNGLMITGYSKSEDLRYSSREILETLNGYSKYKKQFNSLRGMKGILNYFIIMEKICKPTDNFVQIMNGKTSLDM